MTYEKIILFVYCGWLLFMSLVAIILYKKDKKLAIKNKNRIKEKTLLGVTAMGGALGALLARIMFRHKTDKMYFSLVIYFSLMLELIALATLVYFGVR